MKQYNFDELIDRKGSGALKTDALQERFGKEDLIPMWVADMDFRTGDFIVDALKKRCEHEVFGYTIPSEGYLSSITSWLDHHHAWKVENEWLSFIPGIVKGIAFTIINFTKPGDKIIIQPPVYHPFHHVPTMHHRELVMNPLKLENGAYIMDLEHLETIVDSNCKILILCNPHNPIGVTWDKACLKRLAEICYKHNILVISDEIHSDMALFGNKHIPFASVSEQARENSITFMAPSKTFNIAGIVSSFAIVPNEKIRESFFSFLVASELNQAHLFAYVATQAAYENGAEWLKQMLAYVEGNILFVDNFLKKELPQIKAHIPQASFLIWLDCNGLNLNQEALVSLFINDAGLALNNGAMFGSEGSGYMRLNIACPKSVLEEALDKLKKAVLLSPLI